MAFAEPSAPAAPAPPAPVPGAGGASPAVWCSGVRKAYGRRPALHGISLEVPRGEVVGLLGPNGAGKSTLIKILLGLVGRDAGEVMLLGVPGGDPRSRATVGYLPELFRYQPWLTPDEVLALHGRLAGVDWPRRRRRESLAEVGLADRAGDRVAGFSKGMQQRLGLAVALVGDPALVILDEPTSALDPIGRVDVRDLVVRLRQRGTTVLLNSHLLGEVERVCDRVVVLDRGRVCASGTLTDLLGRTRVKLRLQEVGAAATQRLRRAGQVTDDGAGWYTVTLPDDPATRDADDAVPALVAELAALGVRIHAVEPSRLTLEEKVLGILRASVAAR